MDPFTIFMIASTASAGLGSVSNILGASAQAGAYREQSTAALMSAEALKEQAIFEEERMREQGESLKSVQRVAYLASGIDVASETPLKVMSDTAFRIERDVQQYKSNVAMEVKRLETEAAQARRAARKSKKSGVTGALTSILGAGANLALSGGGGGAKAPEAA